jgi:hypothetical protein
LKGIPKEICEHKIELVFNAQQIKQRQYKMNPNYALKMREDLYKLFDAIFIYPIETTQWLSPLVIVPKKNEKLQICVDYRKLKHSFQNGALMPTTLCRFVMPLLLSKK